MAWHTPILRTLFPGMLWHFPRNEKAVYLTFDDGPDPEITPRVLDLLSAYGAKATFFCVGNRVEDYPEIYRRILAEGHSTGNHTWSHPNGWFSSLSTYVDNVKRASQAIDSSLFRPPYGKLTPGQWLSLKRNYRVVMWDVLPGDWKASLTSEQIVESTMQSVKPGSVVVFHDSKKAAPRMLPALEQVLARLTSGGYVFKSIA